MAILDNDDKPKIQMLLDIENIFGESTRGLGRFITTILLIVTLPMFFVYSGLFMVIPIPLLVIVCLLWALVIVMIIPGEMFKRLADYRKRRDNVYALADDMVRVRTIHPQGCIEYINGSIMFMIVTYNNSDSDTVKKSVQIRRFLELAVGKQPFDIRVQNINDTDNLDSRYSNVKLFSDSSVAMDFIEIIDFNRQAVSKMSTLTRNIICIYGSKYQWKEIAANVEAAVNSESARVFRKSYLVTDPMEVEDIISRDVNGRIDLNEMLQKKYYTGNTYGSKIISYDFKDVEEAKEEKVRDASSFIPKQ